MSNTAKLEALNAFRKVEGLAPYADWRPARHQQQLDSYLAAAEAPAMTSLASVIEDVAEEVAPSLSEIAGNADFADHKELQAAAKITAKSKTYKQVARYGKSSPDNVCGFIHQFLSDNPDMTRKEAVIALTEGYGVNYSTARTQYQRWFAARK